MAIREATSVVLAILQLGTSSAEAQAPGTSFRWENKQLIEVLPREQYEAQGQQALQFCEREARMALPLIPPQACQRAMSSGSLQVLEVCQATGVDCTEAFSSPSPMLWDQCSAYANQVAERRQYAARRAGLACMAELGWKLKPAK